MRRYKLIKPLPVCEVGDGGFYIDSDGNLMHCASDVGETVYPAPVLVRHPEILKDWFEEIPERPKTVWDLKEGDEFWAIEGADTTDRHYWDGFEYHRALRGYGDAFLTKEDAEKELARRKAKVILERDTKEFKPDSNNPDEWKYYVDYSMTAQELITVIEINHVSHEMYFATKEDAKASIKAHEKEWKIYLGGVEE